MKLTGGQALARQLVLEGITDVFGIPGVQLDWAVDGLRQLGNQIRYVVTRHEQTTAYMADGYARSTGKIGTCMVVPGPGLLNAWRGSPPLTPAIRGCWRSSATSIPAGSARAGACCTRCAISPRFSAR